MLSLLFNFLGSGAGGRATVLALCLGVAGCQVPQWRVGQAKVPEPLQKPAVQVEAERQAADVLARTVTTPPEMIPVAQKLSASLGEPARRIETGSATVLRDDTLEALAKGVQASQSAMAELNAKLARFDGKKIEGTGFNMFGVGVSLPVLGLIAFLVFCPSIAVRLLWSTLKKVRGCLAATVEGIQNFKAEHPDAAPAINTKLDQAQDAAHKALVKKVKAKL